MPKNWNYNENKNKIIIDPPKQTFENNRTPYEFSIGS